MLVTLLVLLVGIIVGHYISYDDMVQKETIKDIADVTKLPSPSLSVSHYEPRELFHGETTNPAYPQMPLINRMDFIYAQ